MKIGAEVAVKAGPPHCLVFTRKYPHEDRLVISTAIKRLERARRVSPLDYFLFSSTAVMKSENLSADGN